MYKVHQFEKSVTLYAKEKTGRIEIVGKTLRKNYAKYVGINVSKNGENKEGNATIAVNISHNLKQHMIILFLNLKVLQNIIIILL